MPCPQESQPKSEGTHHFDVIVRSHCEDVLAQSDGRVGEVTGVGAEASYELTIGHVTVTFRLSNHIICPSPIVMIVQDQLTGACINDGSSCS